VCEITCRMNMLKVLTAEDLAKLFLLVEEKVDCLKIMKSFHQILLTLQCIADTGLYSNGNFNAYRKFCYIKYFQGLIIGLLDLLLSLQKLVYFCISMSKMFQGLLT